MSLKLSLVWTYLGKVRAVALTASTALSGTADSVRFNIVLSYILVAHSEES